MKHNTPEVDYRSFRFSKLNSDEFRHLKLMLYWPIYGLLFVFVERYYPVSSYYPMHCAVDDWIPFCEVFVVAYMLWFLFLAGTLLYLLFYDVEIFTRTFGFLFYFTVGVLIFMIFPNCQQLRPESFVRDNVFTKLVAMFYSIDTNTNVCPSLHVAGSFGAMFGIWHSKRFRSVWWKISSAALVVLITLSTIFIKQHSVIDCMAALPLTALGYLFSFGWLSPTGKKVSSR